MDATNRSKKARIAHLSGPTATIQNTPPLVTSNKARAKHGLPLLTESMAERCGTTRCVCSVSRRLPRSMSNSFPPIRWSPTPASFTGRPMDTSVQMARSEKNDAAIATSRSTRSS